MEPLPLMIELEQIVAAEVEDADARDSALIRLRQECQAGAYRNAWLVLDRLRRSGHWIPSPRGEALMEKFWWDVGW